MEKKSPFPFENTFTGASIISEVVVDRLTEEQEQPQAGSKPPPLSAAAVGNVLSRINIE